VANFNGRRQFGVVMKDAMGTEQRYSLSRRSFLLANCSLTLASQLPPALADQPREFRLKAFPSSASLVGGNYPRTAVWAYDGTVPGPLLRLRQGEPVRIVVTNALDQDTTVHWHGIRLPNNMDGVPGLTQPPIKPGESFTYEFTPPDAGTYWYHPHANSLQQLGRGLAGALIVEERKPMMADRDLLWVLTDWRLNAEAQISGGFGNMMEAGMAGRVGNTVTLNGKVPEQETVRAGERIRLRLVNTALARIMALRFEGHNPVIVAIDGQPCDPHEPKGSRILLGPAMRVDVVLDMQGEPGRRYRVIDDFYDGLSYWLTELAYDDRPALRAHPLAAPVRLASNPLPEPDIANAVRHQIRLEGGMMGGGMMGMGGMGMGGMMNMGDEPSWSMNGTSMSGDGHAGMAPMISFQRGRSVVLTLRNETAWWHPMHFHGHSFRILTRNGSPVPHRQWGDTVLLQPKETVEVAFVADNPGDWMLHCHVIDHQTSGMMTVLRVA
jgi:FtsP/CotA-like multicopper oxidase with cupredoxin domain